MLFKILNQQKMCKVVYFLTQNTIFTNVGVAARIKIFSPRIINYIIMEVFVEQPLALPGSTQNKYYHRVVTEPQQDNCFRKIISQ